MNLQDGYVVLVTRPDNRSMSDLWKCFYFIRAVILGFKIIEASAILYSDDVGVRTIDMNNVSIKHKGHKWTLSCERNMKLYGKSRKTSIVMEGNLIHILGLKWSIQNAITSLRPLCLGCCVN
ncbi:hypothetical protein HHK36_018648 [Tetracentron sinense]|uniref:Uncharacterized protein n=1 Tax=Tetracentron sinense TaxID=13715 RepID=A0A834YYU4_TETSI|nr:hypothetical protein HHK36_018648 [Tetracentron sinense]